MKIDFTKIKEIKLTDKNRCDGCPFYSENLTYIYSEKSYSAEVDWCSIGYEIENDNHDSEYYLKRPLKCIKENGL